MTIEVVEIQGRRARITTPSAGWVSLYSAEGYEICKFLKPASAPVAAAPAPVSSAAPVDLIPSVLDIKYKPGLYKVI